MGRCAAGAAAAAPPLPLSTPAVAATLAKKFWRSSSLRGVDMGEGAKERERGGGRVMGVHTTASYQYDCGMATARCARRPLKGGCDLKRVAPLQPIGKLLGKLVTRSVPTEEKQQPCTASGIVSKDTFR